MIIIVGHHSRIEWVAQLQRLIPDAAAVVDYQGQGAQEGHRKALMIARDAGTRCIIMEDDALPVVGFEGLAQQWCDRFPDDLISFYLGTGRPESWQQRVDNALATTMGDTIMLSRLIHGVCYSVPTHHIDRVLDRLQRGEAGADYAIGRAWGRGVIYPVESLVEHRDGDSVERHPDGEPRAERRVARRLAGPLMHEGDP